MKLDFMWEFVNLVFKGWELVVFPNMGWEIVFNSFLAFLKVDIFPSFNITEIKTFCHLYRDCNVFYPSSFQQTNVRTLRSLLHLMSNNLSVMIKFFKSSIFIKNTFYLLKFILVTHSSRNMCVM